MSPPTPAPAPAPAPRPDVVARLRAAGCVFAEDEARLIQAEAHGPADLDAMVGRRAAGLPLEQVLGWAEFGGLRLVVEPGVFVPRHRSELLVAEATALVRRRREAGRSGDDGRRPVVVDLCCGIGALGAVLATALDGARPDPAEHPVELYAVDIDPAAVRCARQNLAPLHGTVLEGDLYEPLPARLRGRVDVVLANVPYVPTEAIALMPSEARVHERRVALDGGRDGLDVLRRVANDAPAWLAPGGHLVVETSGHQVPEALDVMARAGLVARLVSEDDEEGSTVVVGTAAPAPRDGSPRSASSTST